MGRSAHAHQRAPRHQFISPASGQREIQKESDLEQRGKEEREGKRRRKGEKEKKGRWERVGEAGGWGVDCCSWPPSEP